MKIPRFKNLKKWPKILKSRRIIVAVVAVVLITFFATRGGSETSKIKTAQVTEKTLESEVTVSGEVKSREETNLRFQTSGKLAYIGVKQGDYVRSGQTVASLDSQELEKRLKRDLNTYFKTRLDFEDVKDSQKDKVITDTLKRIAQRSQADLDNSVIDVEIRDLAIQFSRLTSPINGYIINKGEFFAGNFVFPTDTIATVADFGKLQFVAEVDESEIGQVKVGQKAYITFDAFDNQPIETQVDFIGPKTITTSTGATAFEVKINLDPPENLRLGMNGEAEIIIQEVPQSLTIPLDALVNDKYVWLKTNDTFQKREIQKGLESELEVQITSGLNKGDQLAISGFDQIDKKNLVQKILSFFK